MSEQDESSPLPLPLNLGLLSVLHKHLPSLERRSVLRGGLTPNRLHLLEGDFRGVLTGVPIHERGEDNLRAGNSP